MVSFLKIDQVPGYQLFCQYLLLMSFSDYLHIGGKHFLQALGSLLSFKFLPEAEYCVDYNY
jgi:hypothetical protein